MDTGVLAKAVRLAQDRRPFALATVVWRRAPSSGHLGSKGIVLDDGTVYQTYATTARGLEFLMGYYPILDRAPKGRDEEGLPWSMAWVRHHDRYDDSTSHCH